MDYTKVYYNLVSPLRNGNRTKNGGIYYESHHIMPTFMYKNNPRNKRNINSNGELNGSPYTKDNTVLLTPREHFIAHVLLYKMYKGTKYEYKCGASLILFFNTIDKRHKRVVKGDFYNLSKKYENYRLIGIQSISNARSGTFPAKDAITGEMVGSVNVDDPNVLNGTWVHHSKGRILSDEHLRKLSIIANTRNSNSRDYNIEYIKTKLLEFNNIVELCDHNFIIKGFLRWFDSIAHTGVTIVKFKYSNNDIVQKISGSGYIKSKLIEWATEVSQEHKLNWKFPKYGASKYKDIKIC